MWSRLHGVGARRLRVGDRGSEVPGDWGGSSDGGLLALEPVTRFPGPIRGAPRQGEDWTGSSRAPRPPGHRVTLSPRADSGEPGGEERSKSAPEAGAGLGGQGLPRRAPRPARPSPTPPCLLGLGRWGLISRLRPDPPPGLAVLLL